MLPFFLVIFSLLLVTQVSGASSNVKIVKNNAPSIEPDGGSVQFWWKEIHVTGRPLRVWQHEVHAVARSRKGLSQHEYMPYGTAPHFFVRYSAYRYSSNKIFALGLSAAVHLENYKESLFSSCLWLPETEKVLKADSLEEALSYPSAIIGEAKTLRGWGTHGRVYDTVVIECTFNETVNGNGNGGFLFLQPNRPPPADPDFDSVPVDSLVQPMLVFHEEKYNQTFYESFSKKKGKPVYEVNYAHCGAPLHGSVISNQVGEWYKYHYQLLEKSVHFFVYDVGGLGFWIKDLFAPFQRDGILTIIDAKRQSFFESFYFSQVIFLNDCLHRSRFLAKWIFNFDLDEYFVTPPPQTLKLILDSAKDKYFISFGSFLYTVRHCLKKKSYQEWKVEHTVYREETPICVRNREQYNDFEYGCQGTDGRRKWMMNPRMVALTKVHSANKVHLIDRKTENQTLHVNAREAWLGHFRRITLPPVKMHCEGGFHTSEELDFLENGKYGVKGKQVKYFLDTTVKKVAQEIRTGKKISAVG